MLSKQQITVRWMTNKHFGRAYRKHEKFVAKHWLWDYGVDVMFFIFGFRINAISSVIRTESISICSFGSLMFEFSVKCNNLIDWHAKQIAFDTLIHNYLATPNSNLQRYSLSTLHLFIFLFGEHVTYTNTLEIK